MATEAEAFFRRGWCRFGHDPALAVWAAAACPVAEETLHDPELRARWLRCGGTWFAGVNALPNDDTGAVRLRGVPQLTGAAVDFIAGVLGFERIAWDRAQVSICFPGYPQPWEGESDAAFRFRRDRDAAHVDGLLRLMPGRRRCLGETHGFILGVPLTETPPDAVPFTVYEGSHELMRRALRSRLGGIPSGRWAREDITEAYTEARRQAFESCRRITVPARPGEAYIAHRLLLHGVAPWGDSPETGPRVIAYFRPDPFPGAAQDWWLERP